MLQPFDLPLNELVSYLPALTKQPDFDRFWEESLAELANVPVSYELIPVKYPVRGVNLYKVVYKSFNNAEVGGFYAVPAAPGKYPGLVCFHGYNWAIDGNVHDTVNWALNGYACLQMHVRGQYGESRDNVVSSNGHVSGWMTKGILDPKEYYYRAIYMDAVRAVEVLASMENVNAERIGVTGGSQGGGLTLAAAALSSKIKVAVADFPYLSHFNRAIEITPNGPYNEFNEYFRRNTDPEIEMCARRTLTYFDVMNLAPRISCFTLVNIGLVDDITPPSTVFAAYNHLTCEKKIGVYRYFGHEFISGAVVPKLETLMEHLMNEVYFETKQA